MPYLLDVNVLVALFDEAHIHHVAAHAWFPQTGATGWSTCPITENGVLRILSHPAYPNTPLPMSDLAGRLEEFKTASEKHAFWSDDYSLSEWLAARKVPLGSAQSTDAYLLKLCQRKQGTLATFDHRIRPSLIGENSPSLIQYIPV
ncbi:MAG: TA system VapC family ribonuclease toxin [Terrimicrobiaceae bacterium]